MGHSFTLFSGKLQVTNADSIHTVTHSFNQKLHLSYYFLVMLLAKVRTFGISKTKSLSFELQGKPIIKA